ncbi:pollen receptor-like kinase 4, partial [Tanacetum coccineum]
MKAYKSPEFTQHNQRVTKKTDVWCLGILILEMLTGKFPLNYLEQDKGMKRTLWFDKGTTGICDMSELYRERRLTQWWTSKVFDNCMKWAKNNEIEMIDLMDIG